MKNLIIFAMVLISGFEIHAQQDPMVSQYMFNGLYLNPAYAGSHKYWSSTLSYRNQWVRFDGAPQTVIAAVDGPLPSKNMGLGAVFFHDQIGVTNMNSAVFSYAYQLKLNENSKLAMGVNAGFSQFSAKLTQLQVWDTDDDVFDSDLSSKILPRFGLGLYYFGDKHYVGLSVPTLLAYERGYDFNLDITKSSFLRRHYLLTAGYVFGVTKDIKLKPSVLFKYVQSAPLEVDLNLSAVYRDMIWFGVSYRSMDALVFIAEYQTNSYFRVGYAYDMTLSKLRNYSSGSHEIMLGIDFGRDLVKVKTPRYF